MQIRDFRALNVSPNAFESAFEIFKVTRTVPKDEKHSLTDQMCRSSRPICANLAGAWRQRRYSQAFASQLSDADAVSAETTVGLDMALKYGCLASETFCKIRPPLRATRYDDERARKMLQ
jgi:four helix bundle protein